MKDWEFLGSLKDHDIGNENIYRLRYVNYHRIGTRYGIRSCIGLVDWPCSTFRLPEGMRPDEAFTILSYLTDFIEKREDIEIGSLAGVIVLDKVLELERFGFKKVREDDEEKITDLFTVSGRILLFKMSRLYKKYFNWYTQNVSREEVKDIYAKYNVVFEDIVWRDKDNDNFTRTLEK